MTQQANEQAGQQAEQPALASKPGEPWNEADEAWVQGIPREMQAIARRIGRPLFVMAWHSNAAQHAMNHLMRRVRGNRDLEPSLIAMATAMNEFTGNWMLLTGIEAKAFMEARKDIELVVQLAHAGPGQAGGRIILPN